MWRQNSALNLVYFCLRSLLILFTLLSTVTQDVNWSEINKYGFINQLLNATKGALRNLYLEADFGADYPPHIASMTFLDSLSLHTTSSSSNSYDFSALDLISVNLSLSNGATPVVVSPRTWFPNAFNSMRTLILHKTTMTDLNDLTYFPMLTSFECWGDISGPSTWTTFAIPRWMVSLSLHNLPETASVSITTSPMGFNSLSYLYLALSKDATATKSLTIETLPRTISTLTIEGSPRSTLIWSNTLSAVPSALSSLVIRNVTIANPGLPAYLQSSSLTYTELQLLHGRSNPLADFPTLNQLYTRQLILSGLGWGPTQLADLLCNRISTYYLSKLHIFESSMLTMSPPCLNTSSSLSDVSFVGARLDILHWLPRTVIRLQIDRPALPQNVVSPSTRAQFASMTTAYLTIFRTIPTYLPYLVDFSLTNGGKNVSLAFPSYEFEALPYLRSLNFTGNNLTGTIHPYWLSRMSSLTILNLNNNFLTGVFPWINYQVIQEILVRNNNFTSWPTLENTASLIKVDFAGNRYLSRIPNQSCWNSMTSLQYVDLSRTNLLGAIPEAVFNSGSSIISFIADSSKLTGTFPGLVKNMNLEVLSLRNTGMCGEAVTISTAGDPLKLYHLDLAGTKVSGSLYDGLGYRFWDYLDLSSTGISGTVITPYFHPTHPSTLNFSNTNLQGVMFPVDNAGKSWIPGRETVIDMERTSVDFCSPSAPVNITSPFVCRITVGTNACNCESRWSSCAVTSCSKKRSGLGAVLSSSENSFAGSYEILFDIDSSQGINNAHDESTVTKRQYSCTSYSDWPGLMDRPPVLSAPLESAGPAGPLCQGPQPAVNAICVRRNVWRVPTDLSTSNLVVPPNTRIEINGSLFLVSQSSSLTYENWFGFISVRDCLLFDGHRADSDWKITIKVEKDGYSKIPSTRSGFQFIMGEQNTTMTNCASMFLPSYRQRLTVPSGLRFKMTGTSGCAKLDASNAIPALSYDVSRQPWIILVRRNTTTCKILAGVLTPVCILIVVALIITICVCTSKRAQSSGTTATNP